MQMSSRGDIEGCRNVKVSKVKPATMNTLDVWPDAPEAKLFIPEFDLSMFGDYNGMLYTPYTEIPWRVERKNKAGAWKQVKEAWLKEEGYEGLIMRVNFYPINTRKLKFHVLGLPTSLDDLPRLGDGAKSRAFPAIKVHQGLADLVME